MYWASNNRYSTTTIGSPISFEGGTTILVSNWSWFDIEPFPSLFDGDFWRWIYRIIMRRSLNRKKFMEIRNRFSWPQRRMARNREYRSRPEPFEEALECES